MATTVITDETVTISLRMGATLAMAAIGDGTADIVYTLPGEAEQTDALAGTVERVYGPYQFGQDFEITATDSVQAVTTFGTLTANATIQRVDSLPALGVPNVIYQTATAAYWWNGVAFIAMGSGAAGAFTSVTVTDNALVATEGGNVGIGTDTPADFAGYTGVTMDNATNGSFVHLQRAGVTQLKVEVTPAGAFIGGPADITLNQDGNTIVANIPTSASGLPTGALWSDGGTIKIV